VAHAAIRNRGTIGGSIAYADPAAELPACAMALRARMIIAGTAGSRTVPADRFFLGLYETALRPDEILVALEFDVIQPDERPAFAELARRQGDYALVGLAAQGKLHASCLDDLRLVYFSVGPTPVRARAAEALLSGRPVTREIVTAAQAALSTELSPPNDSQASSAARLQMARILLGRIVSELAGPTQLPSSNSP
jgi:carbon-monoxide dehydrogenase medium subunit